MITSEEPAVSPSGVYSITQTCAVLGICYNTLMKYVRDGLLVPMEIGSLRRMHFKGERILRFWRTR